jgi:predicted RND superfamily exporter protein
MVLRVPPSPHVQHTSRLLDRFARILTRHPRPALAAFGLLIVTAGYYALQVKAQPDSFAFLPKSHQVVKSYDFIADRLTGLQSMEVVIDTPGGWTNTEYWPSIEKMMSEIGQMPSVSRVFGPFDFLRKINQWNHDFDVAYYKLPETQEDANKLLALMTGEDGKQLRRFQSDNGERIRFTILMRKRNGAEIEQIINETQQKLNALPKPMHGEITGMARRMHEFEYGLLQNQITSYVSSLLMVFAVIFVGLRSLRLTLILLPPNIVPLLAVFTTMGLLGISLDVATVMVASISLGIAVDETVILLSYYRWVRGQGKSNFEAIHDAMSDVGPACIVTSIVACIGFFTLALSIFIPISNFGMLCGIAMFTAVASNLVLLPAVLALSGDEK